MYYEYKNFIRKRLQYLIQGDSDTPTQTYYTVMVERIPSVINSVPSLTDFFEKLFPGDIYSVELALDLTELESLIEERKRIKRKIEFILSNMKDDSTRPTVWIHSRIYHSLPEPHPSELPSSTYSMRRCMGYVKVYSIEHYNILLEKLNAKVQYMQDACFKSRQRQDEMEHYRMNQIKKMLKRVSTDYLWDYRITYITFTSIWLMNRKKEVSRFKLLTASPVKDSTEVDKLFNLIGSDPLLGNNSSKDDHPGDLTTSSFNPNNSSNMYIENSSVPSDQQNTTSSQESLTETRQQPFLESQVTRPPDEDVQVATIADQIEDMKTPSKATDQESIPTPFLSETVKRQRQLFKAKMKMVGDATISAVEGIAHEGMKTAEFATQGALR